MREHDYHTQAVEMLEKDGQLSLDETLDAVTFFEKNEKAARSYCTFGLLETHTAYIRKCIETI